MKTTKMEELISILSKSDNWIPSCSLAKIIGTSERTIRNYIKQINEENNLKIISSKNGYRIENKTVGNKTNKTHNTEERTFFLLSKLLSCKNGISVFDAAEELMISESTVMNNVIPSLKELISSFHLTIESHNYNLFLIGKEQDKRKLIGYLVTHNNYGYFTSNETLEKLFPAFNIQEVIHELYNVCDQSKFFINNFALNNLLVHILIILIRLQSEEALMTSEKSEDVDSLLNSYPQTKEVVELANNISEMFQTKFNATIPEKDYQQILLLIILSIDYGNDTLNSVIEPEFIETIKKLVSDLSNRYNIPKFDQEFISQFTLHMYNAKNRSQFSLSYPNPIANQIKKDYAPVYDMAVYFSHIFSNYYNLSLVEDEIAFIAFHIGSYLENNRNYQSLITCIIIVESYLNFSKNIVQELEHNFSKDLVILNVMSLDQYMISNIACDILITTVNIPLHHDNKILINPILTKNNIVEIKNSIETILEKRKLVKAQAFLNNMFDSKLYFRNVQLNSPEDYIKFMGKECSKFDYIQDEFIQDVLLRESLSSTAFTDCLAVPHAISKYAEKSFICIIHNDMPIKWAKKKVNFILMIGISENEMKYFNEAFNLLIDLFLDQNKLFELLSTKNFNEFISVIF